MSESAVVSKKPVMAKSAKIGLVVCLIGLFLFIIMMWNVKPYQEKVDTFKPEKDRKIAIVAKTDSNNLSTDQAGSSKRGSVTIETGTTKTEIVIFDEYPRLKLADNDLLLPPEKGYVFDRAGMKGDQVEICWAKNQPPPRNPLILLSMIMMLIGTCFVFFTPPEYK
jgi:hypothetical protein